MLLNICICYGNVFFFLMMLFFSVFANIELMLSLFLYFNLV